MLHAIAPLGLNGLELLLVFVALSGLALVGRRLGWSEWDAVLAAVLVVPVLILTAAEATQFMTMDEWGMSDELFDPTKREFRSISLGAFGVGLVLALPVTRLGELLHLDPTQIRMMLKALWWVLGQGIVAALALVLLRLRAEASRVEPHLFAAVFAALALLPTTQLGLKTFNYDLLSFGFGALALVLLLRRLLSGDRGAGWVALLCAALAAREKLTAGPILLVVIVALALASAAEVRSGLGRVRRAVLAAAAAIGITLLVSLLDLALYRLLGPSMIPGEFWRLAADPLSAWAWIPLGLFLPIATILAWRVPIAVVAVGLVLVGVVLLAFLLPMVLARLRPVLQYRRALAGTAMALMAGVLVLGIVGTATVQGYWAPFRPTALARVVRLQAMNGVSLHVDAATPAAHLAKIILYALAVLVVAIPSVIWVGGLLGGIAVTRMKRAADRPASAASAILIVVGLATPIGAALMGVPFAHRYFNLSLALIACGMLLPACVVAGALGVRHPASVVVVSALFIAALIIETAPFRPLFAPFRPFWLSYADAVRAEPGRLNASWMGWGEEIMTAGKQLEQACREKAPIVAGHPCSELTLFTMHSGLWLPGPSAIKVRRFVEVLGDPPLDDRSFYVANRLYLLQNTFPIPSIPPDLTVAHRGYVLAWVWRGDRLKRAGYRLSQ